MVIRRPQDPVTYFQGVYYVDLHWIFLNKNNKLHKLLQAFALFEMKEVFGGNPFILLQFIVWMILVVFFVFFSCVLCVLCVL